MDKENDLYQQSSRDINNVTGSQYIINSPTIHMQIKSDKDIELKFTKLEKVNYLTLLQEECKNKNLIQREEAINDIVSIMKEKQEIIVYGKPGIGKTVFFNELAKEKDSVYISLRNKSLKRVITYLVNSFEIDYKSNDDDILTDLETLLQTSNKIFLIDDCDSNMSVLNQLLGIEKFNNHFIYGSRIRNVSNTRNVEKYELKPFTINEIELFVKINVGELKIVELNELIYYSQGNPLYLYYFSRYQIKSLPKDLEDYQEIILESLGSEERELLNYVAVSSFPIKFLYLKKILDNMIGRNNSPMYIKEKLGKIESLLKINGEEYEIFHLSFRNYILESLSKDGMIDYYKEAVGTVFLDNKEYIDATILLRDSNPTYVKDYIFSTSHYLYLSGDIQLSAKVLEKGLSLYIGEDEKFEQGYTNYHLSLIYIDIDDREKAFKCIDKAIDIFEELNHEFYILSLTFKAQFLAEEGKKEESMQVLKILLDKIPEDKLIQAMVYLNVSKIYISFNQYKTSVEFAKKAYEIFKNTDDKRGIYGSLLNYCAGLANIDEVDLATEYLENLLKEEEVEYDPRIKAAILNNLTMCYRKQRMYLEAKTVCLQSIEICKRLKSNLKVAMNLLNLGNIFRDEAQFEKSESAYREGLDIAIQYGYIREVGRANELLANIYNIMGKYNKAIEYASNAISESSSVNDSYRTAEAYVERANAYKGLNNDELYIQDIDKAIKHYLNEGFNNEALYQLVESIAVCVRFERIDFLEDNLIQIETIVKMAEQIDFETLCRYIEECTYIQEARLIDLYKVILSKYFSAKKAEDIVTAFLKFIKLCLDTRDDSGEEILLSTIDEIIRQSIVNNNGINLLANTLGKTGSMLGFPHIENIVEKISQVVDGFYYRELPDGTGIITVMWENDFVIQIYSTKLELIEYKVAVAVALIIKFNSNLFCQGLERLENLNLEMFIVNYDTFNKEVKKIDEDSFEGPVSAVFSYAEDYTVPVVVILDRKYESRCDDNLKNSEFIWILMNLYLTIRGHIAHIDIHKRDELLAKEARCFAEKIIGNNIEQDNYNIWD